MKWMPKAEVLIVALGVTAAVIAAMYLRAQGDIWPSGVNWSEPDKGPRIIDNPTARP